MIGFPRGRRNRVVSGIAAAIIVAGVATVVSHDVASPVAAATAGVTVTSTSCAPQWKGSGTGQLEFSVTNSSDELYEIELVGSDKASVYGSIEELAPRTTVPLDAVIGPGTYYWRCIASLGAVTWSSGAKASGPAVAGVHAYLPASYAELAEATTVYRTWISNGLRQLAVDTDSLLSAAKSYNRTTMEKRWLIAHLDYARLGAAYGTFGAFNDEIDGRPNGLPRGVADPSFTGFLRLEYGLWHDQPAAELTSLAKALDRDVHGLVRAFPTEPSPPTDVALRSHEILENALQFELTGETDMGSHTNLATAAANVVGAQASLSAITPLLTARDPTLLTTARAGLAALLRELDTFHRPDGAWVALDALSRTQREQLDGMMSQLLEELAPVPDILELSTNSADPD